MDDERLKLLNVMVEQAARAAELLLAEDELRRPALEALAEKQAAVAELLAELLARST